MTRLQDGRKCVIKLNLFGSGEREDKREDRADIDSDKSGIIDSSKSTHNKLTVHTISDTAVTRNEVGEIFDFESTFEAAGKEATKRSDEGSKGGEGEGMELGGIDPHGGERKAEI